MVIVSAFLRPLKSSLMTRFQRLLYMDPNEQPEVLTAIFGFVLLLAASYVGNCLTIFSVSFTSDITNKSTPDTVKTREMLDKFRSYIQRNNCLLSTPCTLAKCSVAPTVASTVELIP
jgi:hypothetical protein